MFASHKSYEIGYQIAMDRLGLAPMFDLGMRLGEGERLPDRLQDHRNRPWRL